MITNLSQLRTLAVRNILRKTKAAFLLRHALCKPWVASTQLNEMAWTDFKSLFFNFPRIQTQLDGAAKRGIALNKPLDPGEHTTAFLAAASHEILHVLWLHHFRSDGKLADAWSAACEYAINFELVNYFGKDWIKHLDVMYPSNEMLTVLSAAKLPPTTDGFYEILSRHPAMMPKPDSGKMECKFCARAQEAKGKEEFPDASGAVRVLHHLPTDSKERENILRFLTAQQEQARKIPWEMLLLGGIEDAMSQEQSWAKPSRRDEELPTWQNEKLLNFVWILDVSPSIDDTMKQSFMNTLQAGINLYHDAQHRVIFFADGIVEDIMVSSGTNLTQMEIPCGNGTDLKEVWEVLERDMPEYALVLTDLELSPVPKPSFTKIVWGIVGEQQMFHPDYGIKVVLK